MQVVIHVQLEHGGGPGGLVPAPYHAGPGQHLPLAPQLAPIVPVALPTAPGMPFLAPPV